MPIDVAALADMSGIDKNLLALFLKGADGLSEDYIVDEVFALKDVVDVLGTNVTMDRLRELTAHTKHDEILPLLVSEKEAFLEHAASAPAAPPPRAAAQSVEHEQHHGGHHTRAHSKDTEKEREKEREREKEKEKEKEKEGGFLKWIFKGKKKEHSQSVPAAPHPMAEELPAPEATAELLPTVTPKYDPRSEPQPEPEPEPASDAHAHKHRSSSAPDVDEHKRSHSEKKSKKSKQSDEPPPSATSDPSITQYLMQTEVEMNRQYSFGADRSTAEATPSASRRQGATADDDFQAIFNQFLSNN